MKTTFRLPPSPRDFAVYEAIVLRGNSTRDAASLFKLSQTRVRQIAGRVVEWLAETLPEVSEADAEKQLRLAKQIAGDRLQLLYGMAFRRFESQQQPQFGMLAMRITEAQLRLGHFGGAIDGVMADAELASAEREDLASGGRKAPGNAELPRSLAPRSRGSGVGGRESAGNAESPRSLAPPRDREAHGSRSPDRGQGTMDAPPKGDCSADAEGEAREAEREAGKSAASASEERASGRLTPAQRAARREFLAAAGPLLSEPGTPQPQALSIEAELRQHGEQTLQRLSRRQRRRLAKAK